MLVRRATTNRPVLIRAVAIMHVDLQREIISTPPDSADRVCFWPVRWVAPTEPIVVSVTSTIARSFSRRRRGSTSWRVNHRRIGTKDGRKEPMLMWTRNRLYIQMILSAEGVNRKNGPIADICNPRVPPSELFNFILLIHTESFCVECCSQCRGLPGLVDTWNESCERINDSCTRVLVIVEVVWVVLHHAWFI